MKGVIAWAVRNRAAMNLILIVTLIAGMVAVRLLKREVFPNFDLDIITVDVPYPGAGPAEVEEGICLKIEEAVRSLDGIKRVTCLAREGLGMVVLELNAKVDVQKILNEVRSEVDRIPSFPELAEDPQVQQITFREPAIRLGIISDEPPSDDAGLRIRELTESIRDEVLQLPNVSQVRIVGERPYQIDVEIPERTLRKYGLSLQDVAGILRRENVEIPGGKIQTEGEAVLLRGKNKRLRGAQIAQLPVMTRFDGTVLTIGDLGTVMDGFDDSISEHQVNGRTAQVLSVDRTSSEDLIAIVNEVKEYVAGKRLPAGFELSLWNDTSIDVRERIELLSEDGLQGLFLVFAVLAIFLEIRLAFWVALGIPFAVLATCGVLYGSGDTLNMLTLFSFLMALGILVDDAIVVSENFHSHMELGKDAATAAIDAAYEVAPSVFAGVFCTVIAFIPLFFVSGVMGKFIACMPLTIVAMLLISLVEGFTILPCHLGHEGMLQEMSDGARTLRKFVRSGHWIYFLCGGWIFLLVLGAWQLIVTCCASVARLVKYFFDRVNRVADKFVDVAVNRCYTPALRWALRNLPLVLALQFAVLLLTATAFRGGLTRYTTFPDMDARIIEAKISYPDGTPPQVTRAGVSQVAEAIQRVGQRLGTEEHPLLNVVHESVGQLSGPQIFGPEPRDSGEFVGGVYVELVEAEHRRHTSQQITELWRQETGPIMGIETAVFNVQPIGPGGKDIEFKLLANTENWSQLEQAAERTKQELSSFEGVFDVGDDSYQGKWEYQLRIKDTARAMGVSTADLAETIRAAFHGEEVMRLQRGRHEVKLMVRYPRAEREQLASLEDVRVRGPDGNERPLRELAEIEVRRGYSEIQRVDQQRAISITANVDEGTNSNTVLASLQQKFLPVLTEEFPGVSVRWGGQKEQDMESVRSLALGALIAIAAMFVLLTFQLQSIIQPLLILYLIPFAAAGAVWGHIVMRLDVTLFSVFGLVALMGMVVNDSIVLLDFINARFREAPHESLETAVVEGSRRRLRPVALNTVTSVIGLVPLLADQSFQAQALIPMGISLVFGLSASTILGLFILPCSYYLTRRMTSMEQNRESPDTAETPRGIHTRQETNGHATLTARDKPVFTANGSHE